MCIIPSLEKMHSFRGIFGANTCYISLSDSHKDAIESRNLHRKFNDNSRISEIELWIEESGTPKSSWEWL